MIRFDRHGQRFQRHLKGLKVSACGISHAPDLFYLSGYAAEGCYGLVGPNKAYMLVPGLALEQASAAARHFKVLAVKKASDAFAQLVNLAVKNHWKVVGYDPYQTPEAYIQALRKLSGTRLRWVPRPHPAGSLRVKKDPEEIRSLRKAGRLVAQGFAHMKRLARPGLRECDLAAEFESYIRKNGAMKTSFDSIVAGGENAAYPHYITGNRILHKNEIVLCDIGCLVDGYCSDLTRTFFLGKITPLGRKIYNTVARAQQLAIQAVKPGVKTAQIDRIAREEIERAGYGRRFIHSTGHGVGVEIHEAPWVTPASTDVLEPGMVITVEPGIYLEGWGGVRIEDTLLVTPRGHEILTR